jgi:DNA invertase Pin-like site-specific DNA recombinase
MMKEWEDIYKNIGADIVVIDVPLLDTRNNKDRTSSLIGDLVLVILSHLAEDELIEKKQLQREGIEAAHKRGKHLGRPQKQIDNKTFLFVAENVQKGLVEAVAASKQLGISTSTFYRRAKKFGFVF